MYNLSMKLNAVAVTSKDLAQSMRFYELLGFKFAPLEEGEQHVDSINNTIPVKLMIDSHELATQLNGEEPTPANHASFAIEYDSPAEVNEIAKKIADEGFKVVKGPWDAFWGHRYATVQDPDSYLVDLYAKM
ncbi:VOC family protein [candidate division WWE3 bacterium]|uniref:VOC family protein n=1 Tax=candidate division WWE3 bacterium TaxID=2053526 RepID=A0A955LK93_UNCKA|nr:VOC family protein [candidate division WWE3 bacterium]